MPSLSCLTNLSRINETIKHFPRPLVRLSLPTLAYRSNTTSLAFGKHGFDIIVFQELHSNPKFVYESASRFDLDQGELGKSNRWRMDLKVCLFSLSIFPVNS